jgi:protocatechuate 3,4-dioxygenase beta subunit
MSWRLIRSAIWVGGNSSKCSRPLRRRQLRPRESQPLRLCRGQILGPFYPLKPLPATSDLTRVPRRSGRAEGQILYVMGRVLSIAGDPVHDATVEVWQANAHGRYTHPSDTNPAALDPNFEGSATLTTDAEGRYRFKTIKPAAYPAGPNLVRPAHIHYQVTGRQDRLVTQMYFGAGFEDRAIRHRALQGLRERTHPRRERPRCPSSSGRSPSLP